MPVTAIAQEDLQQIVAQNQMDRTAANTQVVSANEDGELGRITDINVQAAFVEAATLKAEVAPTLATTLEA